MDYFAQSFTLVSNTATLLVDTSTKDRVVQLNGGGNAVFYGFSNTTCVFGPSENSIVLPAGVQLWGKIGGGGTMAILVTKSPSSVSICG